MQPGLPIKHGEFLTELGGLTERKDSKGVKLQRETSKGVG